MSVLYFQVCNLGLCNQLYCLVSAIVEGIFAQKNVCVEGFYVNLASKETAKLEVLLDIEKTNVALLKHGTQIVTGNDAQTYIVAPMHQHDPQKRKWRSQLLKELVFSNQITSLARELGGEKSYYCVHFRLEIDVILYYRDRTKYWQVLDLVAQNDISAAKKIVDEIVQWHKPWIDDQVRHYANAVNIVCNNHQHPIVLLSAIGKPVLGGLNDAVEWTLKRFSELLTPRRQVIRHTSFPTLGREYSAAVELNIACGENCAGFIATNGSTFSATIIQRISAERQLYVLNFSETEMLVYV